MPEPSSTILRSADRFRTDTDGIVTRHCFAFGDHYDPANTGFGDLVAVNDESVDPARGYGLHRHRDTEIVTWVLEGELEHEDTAGHSGTVAVGTVQAMSAGTGVEHAERNASAQRPVRFVQMWLRAGDPDVAPAYAQAYLGDRLDDGGFVAAAGDSDDAAIRIATPEAVLWIARPDHATLSVPDAPLRHLHVVRGRVGVAGEKLEAGDSLRATGPGPLFVEADGPSEILAWAMRRPS